MAKEKDLYAKYSATSVNTLKNKIAEENQEFNNSFSDFLTIDEGTTKFRILPKHEGENSFYSVRGVHWISVEKENNELGRSTVLNGRIHGGGKRDIIEEYVALAKKKLADDDNNSEKLAVLTHWQDGLLLQFTWIMYALKITKVGEKTVKEFGRLEVKKSIRDQMNSISTTEDVDEPIEIDPFTDPKKGIPILITWNPKAKKPADKYKVNLAKSPMPLTIEELGELDKSKPLSELYGDVYTIDDFEKACEGLRNFDEVNEMGLFDDEEFQEILEEVKKQYSESSRKTSKKGDDFDEMDRETLKKHIKKEGLDIKVFSKMTDDDIRKAIREVTAVEEEAEIEEPEEEEVKEEEIPGIDLDALDRNALKMLIKEQGLEVKVFPSMTDDNIRDKIREVMPSAGGTEDVREEVEEPEEEEVEEPVVKKKPTLADIKKKLQGK